MPQGRRPLADRIEVAAPRLAALGAQTLGHLPAPIRDRLLRVGFDRAQDAFNRGDLEVVFALFDPEVEYGPPPPLHGGERLHGRAAVLDFWRGISARYDNSIENLSLEEVAPGRVVRRARLAHRSKASGERFSYVIRQTTELIGGRVVLQLNVLDHEEA
jgi:hypothetical protein